MRYAKGLVSGAVGGLLLVSQILSSSTAAQTFCAGLVADCNSDGSVTIGELVLAVNISLGNAEYASCPAADTQGDERVSINELIMAITDALQGCECPDCDDDNPCTRDVCLDDRCAHGPITCPDDGNDCTTESCAVETGCTSSDVDDGVSCNDGAGTCQAGACAGLPAVPTPTPSAQTPAPTIPTAPPALTSTPAENTTNGPSSTSSPTRTATPLPSATRTPTSCRAVEPAVAPVTSPTGELSQEIFFCGIERSASRVDITGAETSRNDRRILASMDCPLQCPNTSQSCFAQIVHLEPDTTHDIIVTQNAGICGVLLSVSEDVLGDPLRIRQASAP